LESAISPIWGISLGVLDFFRNNARMNRAIAFLEQFRRAEREGDLLLTFANDPDGFGAALEQAPDELKAVMAASIDGSQGAPAMVNEDCFASAACDQHGALVVGDDRFMTWFEDVDPFSGAVRNIQPDKPRVSLYADDLSGRPVALAAGTVAVARSWPLALEVRKALSDGRASYAIAAFRPGALSWTHAARAYGLTSAESLLVAALAKHGDLQHAARDRDIAYETARKFVASAMRKTGTNRQTALIRQTLMVAAGHLPDAQNLAVIVRDLFALTPRQSELALLLGHGATRERAADIIGISDHRAKADLKIVFQACGVASAVDLARLMTEINALSGLASACDVIVSSSGQTEEPLRLVPRTWAEGRIAVSDFGPVGGKPVLILHSNVSGRHHSRSFIAALREEGFRPITFDRAGYGLTSMIEGDPARTSVLDIVDILDALQIDKAALLARCNTASAVAAAAHATGRITGAVLLWPEAVPEPDRPKTRTSDWGRVIYDKFPTMAESFTHMMCRRTSVKMIEKLWRKSAKDEPFDLALLDDPVECDDIVRGTQQAIYGMRGLMNEALAHGSGAAKPACVSDASKWTLIFSRGYEAGDVDKAISHWTDRLKDAQVEYYEGGGHFMHVTQCAEVIAALERASYRQESQNGTNERYFCLTPPPASLASED
jgi:pimeloyl-ACP methyl ester carboxylesterase/DNA-binding CsgD family transcriptional regulator